MKTTTFGCEEGSLTGESVAVSKTVEPVAVDSTIAVSPSRALPSRSPGPASFARGGDGCVSVPGDKVWLVNVNDDGVNVRLSQGGDGRHTHTCECELGMLTVNIYASRRSAGAPGLSTRGLDVRDARTGGTGDGGVERRGNSGA